MDKNDTSEVKRVSKPRISRLKWERERRSWTQSDVAERIGSTQINVSRWENGVTFPNPYFRQRLSELYGKDPEELDLVREQETSSTEKMQVSSDVPTSPVPLPIWTVPYRRNPFFTGREEVLTHLHTAFEGGNAMAIPLAISGLGGIGKTQIAIEYAYRYRQHYQAVFWIDASTRGTLSNCFLALAALLNLPEQHKQDQDIVVQRAIKQWLTTHTQWLLILDNVENPEIITDYLPVEGTGSVLLTTRLQALGAVAQGFEVEKMELKEGVMFLLRRARAIVPGTSFEQVMEESRVQAKEIVKALDGLPLALDQAGAYIEETHSGLLEYLDLFDVHRKDLLLRRGRFPLDHPASVTATWSLSFQQVEQESVAAADLLRLLAFLDPEAVTEEIITLGATELGPVLETTVGDPLQLDRMVEVLLHYSLIRRNRKAKALSIHRLVQAVLKDGMEKDIQRIWAERAIRAVNRVFPDVELQNWEEVKAGCQRFLQNVQVGAMHSEEYALAFSGAARLFSAAAFYLLMQARYQQAELLLLRALATHQKVPETDRLDMARTLNDLGEVYRYQGKYKEAEPLLQEALEIRQEVLGEEHLDVAQTILHQADLYRARGNYIKAEPLYLRTLHIREALGLDSPLIAESYYGLARLYYSLEKYQQAEMFCERALRIQERHVGSKHPIIASILSTLAKVYQRQNKFDIAKEISMRALRIREDTSGVNHPNVATILNNLVEIYHAEGRYSEAEPLIARALRIHEQVLGPEHPFTAYSLINQAENFFLQGKYDQSEGYYKRALAIREQHLGLDHPHTASTYSHLAKLYTLLERFEEAESFSSKALSIRQRIFSC